MATIFISYSRNSEAIARDLADDIGALGNSVWFDEELTGGQAWWDRILATILDHDVFVFVLDPESLNSTACEREYKYAHGPYPLKDVPQAIQRFGEAKHVGKVVITVAP